MYTSDTVLYALFGSNRRLAKAISGFSARCILNAEANERKNEGFGGYYEKGC
jgi:hypothetical protein